MPDISDEVRADIECRLSNYLSLRPGYGNPIYLASGGSAATYKVSTPDGLKAIKVYDPKFFLEDNNKIEEKRLDLQKSLIGHGCETLVGVDRVDSFEGTAFVEMEYVPWPQLKKVIGKIPDDKVSTIIQQLVSAVVYLENRDIVHRDIKPENIHVSEDFARIKLLDLGVVRGFTSVDEESAESTDHGRRRPFIATAQYSSPEYLFRLDQPSPTLWKSLNLYQVGAVLHDLISKRPLFQDEVDLGNKWLVARAVLAKFPSFPDADPVRLSAQKALAMRCLAKDMNTRMQIVSWSDFAFEAATDPLLTLKSKLAKGAGSAGGQAVLANQNRLNFERGVFAKGFCETIRTELIGACDRAIQVAMTPGANNGRSAYLFEFLIGPDATVLGNVSFEWEEGIQANSASVAISAVLKISDLDVNETPKHCVAVAAIGSAEEIVALDVARQLADALSSAVDLLDVTLDKSALNGIDLAEISLERS